MNDGRGSGPDWEGGLGAREVERGHMAGARAQKGAPVVGGAGGVPRGGQPLAPLCLPPGLLQLPPSRNQSLPVASEASGRSRVNRAALKGPRAP